MIPKAAKTLEGLFNFKIIGAGSALLKLKIELKELKVNNVNLIAPVPRDKLIEHYNKANILFLHLDSLACYEKVLPSKIFEYSVFDKPIIAGVSGYAREFLNKELPDALVFDPLDTRSFIGSLKKMLTPVNIDERNNFHKKFKRANIMDEMAKDIYSVTKEHL